MFKNKKTTLIAMNVLSVIGIILSAAFFVYAWHAGILTSQEKMKEFVDYFGPLGYLMFVLIQIIQVVIPIIPGGVSCLVGVMLYGPVWGFVANYVGICMGSFIVFAIAKYYGRPLIDNMFSDKLIQKYDKWTDTDSHFSKMFAIAIFFPVAPDDFLCYLAGTTKMRWKTYIKIILLCKPFSIAIYSLGLVFLFDKFKGFFRGLR